MGRVIELEPAKEAQRCSEIRINREARDAVLQMNTALKVCEYRDDPFPVSLSEQSYDYIVALIEERRRKLV